MAPQDYLNRFSLEVVMLTIAAAVMFNNLALPNRALLDSPDNQSTVFSYLKNHARLNPQLVKTSQTTTIIALTDQWINPDWSRYGANAMLVASVNSSDPTTIQENVILKTNPAGTDQYLRTGTMEYEVRPGDNIVTIASSFGVSAGTVMKENRLDEYSVIHPGQKLSILPTTGVTHKVSADDTLESIAASYKISENAILDVNDIELPTDILAGDLLVIPLEQVNLPPSQKPASKFVNTDSGKVALSQAAAPPNLAGGTLSFIWPTTTRQITQYFGRYHTGVDISNSQKTPIYAAEDGFVELAGWQSGYGNAVVINHGNGFKTRYGHASELYVSAGDRVAKGQSIAKQGATGRVRGITGIHLHFEIIRNGSRVNPLSYVRP